MNAYSDLKPAWNLNSLRMLRDGGHPTPTQIQLIISDYCNHDCPWCAYRMSGYPSNQLFGDADGNHNPKRFMPTEKAKEIITDAAAIGVQAIQFTGGGEPTVHKDHTEIIKHALDAGMKAALVTNGGICRLGLLDLIPAMSWVRVSLDAGTAETHAAIRRTSPTMFDKAQGTIHAMADAAGRSKCHVGVSFVVMKENVGEVVLAAQLALMHGADSIRFSALFSPEWEAYYTDELWGRWLEQRELLEPYANERFTIIDMMGQRRADLVQGSPDYDRCLYQYLNMYIGGDQRVYRCCDTAYNKRGLVGDLTGKRLSDWMREKETVELYREFDPRGCERCAFNGKNRALNYLASPSPDHVEFA